MGKDIKVSVVIPVYNVEKYLTECIESVISQTLREIEIICVNDGSTDRSLDVLEKYAKRDPRIIIVQQENAGAGAARNNGVLRASGQYIGFVDSDDSLYPTMYEELFAKAHATRADMGITGEIETGFGDNLKFPEATSATTCRELELGTFTAIEFPEILKNVFLWNRIYSREFWISQHFAIPEGRKFAEDLLICTQTSVLATQIAYVEGPLYRYRNVRENSLSYNLAQSQKKMDYIVAVDETKQFLKSTNQYQFFAEAFLTFSFHLFALLQKNIADFTCYKEFVDGISSILDTGDIETIKGTWLYTAYRPLISAMEGKKYTGQYIKNRIRCFLNI